MKENDTVVREDLAKTLSILANDSNALYTGDIASSIVKEVKSNFHSHLLCAIFEIL